MTVYVDSYIRSRAGDGYAFQKLWSHGKHPREGRVVIRPRTARTLSDVAPSWCGYRGCTREATTGSGRCANHARCGYPDLDDPPPSRPFAGASR